MAEQVVERRFLARVEGEIGVVDVARDQLIAIPCHIIVRQRDECMAPAVTGFGIATGIAVMLMAFGPSVIFLYQKRLQQYNRKESPASG